MNTSHLDSLKTHLSHEQDRFLRETNPKRKILRGVWVKQLQKEIDDEHKFLGIKLTPVLSDDDLVMLAALEE